MQQIDYNKLDKLLEELYKGDRQYPVRIAETYRSLFKEELSEDRNKIYKIYPKYMAELSEHNLATEREDSGTIMDITPFGRKVFKAGGWIKYNELLDEEKKKQEEKENYKHQLEVEQSEREIEKLKYEKSVRELDEKVKHLTTKNLKLQNFQLIYGFFGALFGFVGAFLSEHWFGLIRILIKYLIR